MEFLSEHKILLVKTCVIREIIYINIKIHINIKIGKTNIFSIKLISIDQYSLVKKLSMYTSK